MVDRVDDLAAVDFFEVDAGDAEVRVLDMRVIWQRRRILRAVLTNGWWVALGDAVGAERRSPGGRPERSAYRVRAVREGVHRFARPRPEGAER